MIVNSIKSAIDIGYRHFDCAAIYNNEKSVGKAINDKIAEGVIKRDEVYITSKVIHFIYLTSNKRNKGMPFRNEIYQYNNTNIGIEYFKIYK